MTHLFEFDQVRENVAIRRLLVSGGLPSTADWLKHLGWNPANCWFALNIPTARLLPNGRIPSDAPGDIDVMGGPLEASSDEVWGAAIRAAAGELPGVAGEEAIRMYAWSHCIRNSYVKWPPDLSAVSAAEFKSGRFDADGQFRSKTHRDEYQRSARGQAQGLCNLGFSRVALIHVLGGERVRGQGDGAPWVVAGAVSQAASNAFVRHVKRDAADSFATVVLSVGAITSRDESFDGVGGAPMIFNEGVENPAAEDGDLRSHRRRAITDALSKTFTAHAFDGRVPVLVLACRAGRCGSVYVARNGDVDATCPSCGGPNTIAV